MSLPILQHQQEIISALLTHQVIIVTGEPGCGKSTKLPQFLIDSKSLAHKLKCRHLNIAVTQPRRVAAIAMATRVASERRCRLGAEVGYSIRFEDRCSSRTCIKYLTDGVLLRECLGSRGFKAYDAIILDEAHERSLDTDILIALLKQHLKKNPKFRLIVTSATLDIGLFAAYFAAPVITITGRQFEIEILHSSCKSDKRVEYVVNAAIRIHLHEGSGDVLAFLTGSDECEKAKTLCFEALQHIVSKGKPVASMLILALYGAMSSEEQAKVFKPTPEDCRKVIFSTNISETSITVDGIGFVIDCGYVKQKQFNPSSWLDALTIVPISKQQARQRAGRAGRTQAGKCFRLYSESFFNEQMQESLKAEIHRSNLATVVLILKTLGVEAVQSFEFIEPPLAEGIVQACKHLFYIGALKENGEITGLGKELSKFPLDPAYARCLISSKICKCEKEMLSVIHTQLISMLSSEAVWQVVPKTSPERLEQARKAYKSFCDPEGDHITYLRVYNDWTESTQKQQWCFNNFIKYRSMVQSEDIREQLKEILDTIRTPSLPESSFFDEFRDSLTTPSSRIRFSLCFSFYMNTGRYILSGHEGSYISVRDNSMLHTDKSTSVSILADYPKWIVYTQLSGSTLIHGTIKMLSKVKSAWLSQILPNLEKLDIDKLMGNPSKKRQIEESTYDNPIHEDPQAKIEEAKQRYLKRKFNS